MKSLLSRYIVDPVKQYLNNLYHRIFNRMKRRWLELMPSFISSRAIKHPFFASLQNETKPINTGLDSNQMKVSKTGVSKRQTNRLNVMQAEVNEPESFVKSINTDISIGDIDKQSSSQSDSDQFEDDSNSEGNTNTEGRSGIFRAISSLIGGNNSNDIAIPPRRKIDSKSSKVKINVDDPETVYRPTYNINFSTSSSSTDFITDAKKYEHRTEKQAEHVPFMQYWPTYSSMNKSQQKWYFYWRTQLRQGNRLPTDTSYLFVHIYEVFHLIGFKSAKDAFKHLANFWKYYRKLQPKLDNYLPDWIADFIIVHQVSVQPLEWYGKITKLGAIGDQDLLVEAWLSNGGDFSDLSIDILFNLANYNPTKSKFYKQYDQTVDLETAYKRGLIAIDNLLKSKTNQSLFEMYRSVSTRTIRRTPFASAVHSFPRDEIEIATVHYWHSNEALGNALKNIIKQTENIIREQKGYKHKLRDIELHSEWESTLEAIFKVKHSQIEAPKPKVEIDLSEVKQLTQESEEIRSRLIIDTVKDISQVQEIIQEPEQTNNGLPDNKGIALDLTNIEELQKDSEAVRDRLILDEIQLDESEDTPPAQSNATQNVDSAGYLERPDNTPDGLLTDLHEVAQILGGSTDKPSKLIALIMVNDWGCTVDTLQSAFEGQFVNVIIDEINERAYEEIGDSLVYEEDGSWIVLEEYRDELEHILEHSDYQNQVDKLNSPTKKYEELDPEWATFADKLQPIHWDILAAIISRVDVENRINELAMQHYSTGNLILDEINEFAQDCFEDILIETVESPPIIVEDEQQNVNDLFNWAATRKIIEV